MPGTDRELPGVWPLDLSVRVDSHRSLNGEQGSSLDRRFTVEILVVPAHTESVALNFFSSELHNLDVAPQVPGSSRQQMEPTPQLILQISVYDILPLGAGKRCCASAGAK